MPEVSKMLSVWQSDNRLYGNSWLLFEIAKITGVYEDLCIVFKDRLQYVNIIDKWKTPGYAGGLTKFDFF